MYREDWNIANVANLGPNFRMDVNTARIFSTVALGPTGLNSGGWSTYQGGSISGKMNSNDMIVSCQLITPPDGTLGITQSEFMCLRKPDTWSTTGTAGTFFMFGQSSNGAWYIYSSVQATATVRAQGTASGFATGDIISFGAFGTVYAAYQNGVLIPGATFTDTGNAIASVGPTKRRWGLLTQVANSNIQGLSPDWCSSTEPNQFFMAA